MTLAEQLFLMMQRNQEAMQLTELVIGTVTGVSPLEITINTAMQPLRKEVLYLTAAVVEKKIPVYTPSNPGVNVVAIENGKTLPVENGYVILNRALSNGDKVLLLRVQHGQQFIVLSRIFE